MRVSILQEGLQNRQNRWSRRLQPDRRNARHGARWMSALLGCLSMGVFPIGLLAAEQPTAEPMQAVDWASWKDGSWLETLVQPQLVQDPTAIAALRQHLIALEAMGMPARAQGIWVQSGRQILSEHQGLEPIPAASLTKIPTTLAALKTWGTSHRFDTTVGITGPIENGVVRGDLVIQGGGDPLFVWEEAIALGNALEQRGIRRVEGNLVITGDFAMNFQDDPQTAGALLRQGINADLWTGEAQTQYTQLLPGTPQPRVVISGSVVSVAQPPTFTPVLKHRSLSLVQVLKAMNIFSNNFIADSVARQLGGGPAVAQKAATAANVPSNEIRLINGSGLGEENQISPRAVVAMLTATQRSLQAEGLSVSDLFPVVGRERGTLGDRRITPGTPVKTGTLDRVSSLAGALPTRDRGVVWFAIIDIGTADLSRVRAEQDRLLQALVKQWGEAIPVPAAIQPSDRLPIYQQQLGDPARNVPL